MSLLGIDVGTSGCKSVIFSVDEHAPGCILSTGYQEYNIQRSHPGWAELDALQVWEKVKTTIRQAVTDTTISIEPIQAVCVSSLGEAFVPVTADRHILGPSLLNFDERGTEFLPSLQEKLRAETSYQLNGNTPGNHYSLTKLLWIKKHQPELYDRTKWFLHWSGFVSFMLGAQPFVDYSLANRTLLFDLQSKAWSEEIIQSFDLEPQKLPPTTRSGTEIGNISQEIALELGIPAGIPIVSGGHDQCCNGVGVGVIESGQAMYGMGTYICMMPVFENRPASGMMIAQGLNTEDHVVPNQFVSFIYNQGGVLFKWFRDTFASLDHRLSNDKEIYTSLLEELSDGPGQVMVLPHFTATGPPHFVSNTSGVITGLHLETTRSDILKGILEGTTFYMRECLESLPPEITIKDFRAAGGGSKSAKWLQICADILGYPFYQPEVNEAGTLGAAILAGVGSGLFHSIKEGCDVMVRMRGLIEPRIHTQVLYEPLFEKYRKMWPLMREFLSE
jgi:xylulokinase